MDFPPFFFMGMEGPCGGRNWQRGCGRRGHFGRSDCRAEAHFGPPPPAGPHPFGPPPPPFGSSPPPFGPHHHHHHGPGGHFPFGPRGEGESKAFDVKENEEHYVFEVDAAGLRFEDISITVEDGELCISTSQPEAVGGYTYLVQERRPQSWSRHFTLPEAVDPAAIYANLTHGVLQVTLPKKARPQPIRIPVREVDEAEEAGSSRRPQEPSAPREQGVAVQEGQGGTEGHQEGTEPAIRGQEAPKKGEPWDMMDQ